MNVRILFSLFPICITAGVTLSFAQDALQGRKLAVVVGNNKYRANQGLEDLRQAVNDATKLSEVLRGAGFKVAEMTHEVARQAGKENFAPNADYIRDQIDNVIETPNLGRDDVVFISLHGHGVQFNLEETVVTNGKEEVKKTAKFYFCPADAAVLGVTKANDLTERNHLIPLDELYRKLEGCSAATKLLIVDACRNDPSKIDNARNLESLTRPQLPPPPGGIAAFFSCKANQRALEDPDLQQGVFTHFLIQGLSGKADQPLENKPADGIVTLSELTSYVSNNTYSYVQDKYQGRRQSPDIKGEFDATLPLIRLPKEKPSEKVIKNTLGMKLVLIPAGEFEMGSRTTPKELAAKFSKWGAKELMFENEHPPHRVKISRSFYLDQHEVTVGLFRQFVNSDGYKTEAEIDGGGSGWDDVKGTFAGGPQYSWKNTGFPQTDDHPVVNVTWNDAQKFCAWLSRKESITYRLPTEAEWEYVCKAGTNTLWFNGDDPEATVQVGNVADATAKAKIRSLNAISASDGYVFTAPVGKFMENPFGLFDMHGNVSEWCEDIYDATIYGQRSDMTADPLQSRGSEFRVLRGGAWFVDSNNSRSAIRKYNPPNNRNYTAGFRVARTR